MFFNNSALFQNVLQSTSPRFEYYMCQRKNNEGTQTSEQARLGRIYVMKTENKSR